MVIRNLFQFLTAVLKQLTVSLAKTGRGNYCNIHEVISQIYPESNVELIEQKGVFCYDFFDYFAQQDKPGLY